MKFSKFVVFITTISSIGVFSPAMAAPLTFNIDGVITDSNNQPLEAAAVTFRIEIKDPSETCLLYREDLLVSMTGSKGYFSVVAGKTANLITGGAATLDKVFSNQATAIAGQSCSYTPSSAADTRKIIVSFNDGTGPQVFSAQEIQSVPFALQAQAVNGYGSGDLLKVASSVNQTTNSNNDLSQTQYDEFWRLVKNPLAAYLPTSGDVTVVSGANKITTFLGQALPAGPATNGQALVSNGMSWVLQPLSNGSVTSVSGTAPLAVGGTATAPVISIPAASTSANGYLASTDWNTFNSKQSSTLSSGKLWVGNASGLASEVTLSGDATLDNAGALALKNVTTAGTHGSASLVPIITTDAQGRVTGVTTAAPLDATKLPLVGGAMTGAITMGGNDITNTGNITMAASKTLGLSNNTTDPGTPTAGQVWYNSTSNTLKYYNGTSVQSLTGATASGITSLNGLTSGTQTFAVNASGSALGFSSATNTHTLNLPLASNVGVNAGLISKAEYDSFNSKLSTINNTAPLSTAKVWIGNASGVAQESSLKGDVTMLSDGSVTVTKTQAGAANTILELNGTGVAVTKGLDIGTAGGTGVLSLRYPNTSSSVTLTLPSSAGSANQFLQTDGTGNLMWATALSGNTGFMNGGNSFGANSSLGNIDNFNLDLKTNNTSRMTILNNGNVGIGTTSPGYSLEVNGDTFFNGGVITSGTAYVQTPTLAVLNISAKDIASNITFNNKAGSEKMRITDGGNIGIGTSTPGSTLDVKGTLRLSGSTSGYVGFAPAATAGSTTYTLPTTQGIAGQVLSTDGVAGTPTLSWITPSSSNLPGLASTKVWVGNASGAATAVNLGGDIASITNAGVVTANKTTTAQANTLLALDGTGVAATMGNQLNGISGSVTLQAAGATTNYSLTFPVVQGSAGQTLSNNGFGSLSWVSTLTNSLTSGKILVGNASNVSSEVSLSGDATMDNAGILTLKNVTTAGTHGSASLVPIITTDAQGRVTNVTTAAPVDATKLPLAGGIMTGTLDMGGNDIANAGNIKMAASKTLGLSSNVADPSAPTAGQVWYNSTSNVIKFYDGTAVQSLGVAGAGITSLNGLTSGAQTFAIGNGGTAPTITSASGTHTFSIPSASAAGVTAGLISKSDYDAFNTKLGSTLPSGQIWVGNSSNVAAPVTPSGDLSITNTGSFTIGAGAVTDTKIASITSPGKIAITSVASAGSNGISVSGVTNGTGINVTATSGNGLKVTNSSSTVDAVDIANNGGGTALWVSNGLTSVQTLISTQFQSSGGGSATAPMYTMNSSTTQGMFFPAINSVAFSTASTERLRIDSTGNVGIGTIAPATKLEVDGTSGATLKIVDGNQGAGKVLTSDANGVASWTAPPSPSSPLSGITAATATNTIANANFAQTWNWDTLTTQTAMSMGSASMTTGSILSLSDSNNSATSTGSVLKLTASGATNAATPLSITNAGTGYSIDVAATGTGTKNTLRLQNTVTAANNSGAGIQFAARTTGGLTNVAGIAGIITDVTNATYKGALTFSTANNGTAPTEAMRIDSYGNVGIGTSTPSVNLHVSGNSSTPVIALIDNQYSNSYAQLSLKNDTPLQRYDVEIGGSSVPDIPNRFAIFDANAVAYRFVIDPSGNVGIGTTTPGSSLDVKGTLRLSGSTSYVGFAPAAAATSTTYTLPSTQGAPGQVLSTDGVAGTTTLSWITPASSLPPLTSTQIWVGNASGVASPVSLTGDIISVSNTGVVTVDKTQTAAPSKILQLDASSVASTKGVDIGGPGTGKVSLRYPNIANNTILTLPSTVGSANQFLQTDGTGTLIWATPSPTLPGLASTQIWVGNASGAATAVTLGGDITSITNAGAVTVNKTTTAQANTLLSLDGTGTAVTMGNRLNGSTSGSVTLLASAATTNYSLTFPATQGAAGQALSNSGTGILSWITPLTSSTGFMNGGNSFGANSNLGNSDSFSLNFITNNTARMTILNTGNVGIGTTTPSAALEVMSPTSSTSVNITNFAGSSSTSYPRTILQNARGTSGARSALQSADFLGAIEAYGNYDTSNSNVKGAAINFKATGTFTSSTSDQTAIIFQTASTGTAVDRMIIDSSGNVGIGVTLPGSVLDLKGTGGMRLEGSTSGYAGLQAPASMTTSTTWTLPPADGTNGQVLSTNGSGTLSWVSAGSASTGNYSFSGNNLTTIAGSLMSISPGAASTTTSAGNTVTITGGAGGTSSGAGGTVTIAGGTPTSGAGGGVNITAANGMGTNQNGGNITLTPGVATGSGVTGVIALGGNVGIGTATPAYPLQVTATAGTVAYFTSSSSFPAVTFQNSSSGSAANFNGGTGPAANFNGGTGPSAPAANFNAGTNGIAVNFSGHLASSGNATSVSGTGCGTGPSITGNDTRGSVTTGSGASVTSCVITFTTSYATAPYCVATWNVNGTPPGTTIGVYASATTLTVNFSASTPSTAFNYYCMQ